MTWSNITNAPQVWAQVSPQAAPADGGVDFELRVHEDYPMIFSEDRSLLFQSSISEGQP